MGVRVSSLLSQALCRPVDNESYSLFLCKINRTGFSIHAYYRMWGLEISNTIYHPLMALLIMSIIIVYSSTYPKSPPLPSKV